ncbi:hypothetical protein G6F57_023532 [Rhizopus arrhizus]|nr:hypothetical protein G6F57_023532 [Rhizopus arrhizus]
MCGARILPHGGRHQRELLPLHSRRVQTQRIGQRRIRPRRLRKTEGAAWLYARLQGVLALERQPVPGRREAGTAGLPARGGADAAILLRL